MTVRRPIRDALRASIEDEDAALAKRLPTGAAKRRASVKRSTRMVARQAQPTGPVAAAKPVEVTLSVDEARRLKALRDQLREQGRTVSRGDLIRLAVDLLAMGDIEAVGARLAALPPLAKKGK
ncbi:hypothetical protein [Denitromonas iodatirespirans]|uniref:Uncharacterized protein n=1 Tax=Denitromonas iodatirespirans TaxID=2795389 RepID=A0A944DF23_DENI1|nr:hypothetical protein [Denitromonas iodatirespirans]MBT0963223.1 hypothetical protein [Denitromonas iodatirespirans]